MHRFLAVAAAAFAFAFSAWGTDWSAAPAAPSLGPAGAADSAFTEIGSDYNLTHLLTGGEGWFWLKTDVRVGPGDEAVMIDGPRLGWEAWLNGRKIADSGSGPPWWRPASPVPAVVSLPSGAKPSSVLLLKAYVREDFDSHPGRVMTGTKEKMRRIQILTAASDLFLPSLAIILGILIFIVRLASFASTGSARDLSAALFGIVTAVSSVEPVLAFFDAVADFIPWAALIILTRVLLPPAVSLWRRISANSGGKEPGIIAVVDFILAFLLTAWTVLVLTGETLVPASLSRWAGFEILPWYAAASLAAALLAWIIGLFAGKRGRFGALLVILAAAAPSALAAGLGHPFAAAADDFIRYGLPLALLACVVIGADRSAAHAEAHASGAESEEPGDQEDFEDDEDIAELVIFDDSEESGGTGQEAAEPTAPAWNPAGGMEEDDPLLKGLRSALRPEGLPWDPDWDLAATRQGKNHPATGYHDVYAEDGKILGFSFMDTGSGSLDATMYAHVVRYEFMKRFVRSRTLAGLARTVSRRTGEMAAAARKGMTGVIGAFRDDGVRLLPLSIPPLLLRKADGNRVISLRPATGRASNPPLGVKGFGEEGLKTLNVAMEPGDALIAFTPTLPDARSSSNEAWGVRRLASALNSSQSRKADGLLEDIIEALKDFTGRDTLGVPLQILVIKRR